MTNPLDKSIANALVAALRTPAPANPPLVNSLANALVGMRAPPPTVPPGFINALRPPAAPPSMGQGLINSPAPAPARKRRVFISFRAEDRNRVNGLRLLAANPDFDIEFYDESVRTPYESNDAVYIRRRIREKITRSSVTVCMVSELTYTSHWCEWEIEESIANRNKIICMGFKDGPDYLVLPKPVRSLGILWWRWDHQLLHRLINE